MALSPKQNKFVAEYPIDLNATQAAIRAGYPAKSAGTVGHALLKKPEIKRAIDAALKRRADRVEVKQDDVLRELLRVMSLDIGKAFDEQGNLLPIHKMPEDVRRALAGVEVEVLWAGQGGDREQVGNLHKVKFYDKVRAIELAGKHLKLFNEKMEHEHRLGIFVVDPYAEQKK